MKVKIDISLESLDSPGVKQESLTDAAVLGQPETDDTKPEPSHLAESPVKRSLREFKPEDDEKPRKTMKLEFDGVVLRRTHFEPSEARSHSFKKEDRKMGSHALKSGSPEPEDTESEASDSEQKPRSKRARKNDSQASQKNPQNFEITPKIKKDMDVDELTIQTRINRVGGAPYPVNLDPELQWKAVSRHFISSTFGGNSVAVFPSIGEKHLAQHGRKFWMFWNLEKHPQAPRRPGEPGVWYDSCPFPESYEIEETLHGFARMDSDEWLYVGDYKCFVAEALTRTEWLLQSSKFHTTWASAIQHQSWGRYVRATIHLRKDLGREPTEEEIDDALRGKDGFQHITVEEVKDAYSNGTQRLGILVLKCVGYDNELQEELIEKSKYWVKPPPKPKQRRPTGKQGSDKRGKKKLTREEIEEVEEEEEVDEAIVIHDVEEEEGRNEVEVIVPRGTKTRPRK